MSSSEKIESYLIRAGADYEAVDGSTWIIQADQLDRHWLGIEWLPSQIQSINI